MARHGQTERNVELWRPPYIHPASPCKPEVCEGRTDILLHGDIGHYPEQPATAD
ncbi:hypothetical protein I8J29_15655 [Paenibacillus sp. MWE-103]|uniref:Uncharacterized protein n=1 Tax=Paenibacillus artemisiicola TaxID=1172618 RepID=A0ABS3WBZ4_9BACL|nr:hypothetical protein [Paenibacillus artemisiicola]MBO7745646.1 hypothetical protein [Paenibacillus artemisiicola]